MKSVGLLKKPLKNIQRRKRALIISVISVAPTTGATHFSLMLAHYLAKQREKVTLVECNESGDYQEIENAYKGYDEVSGYEQGDRFKAKGVRYIKQADEAILSSIYQEPSDIIILDIGTKYTKFRKEILRADKTFVIGHYSDWKRHYYKSFIETNQDLVHERTDLLINLDDGEGKRELKKMVGLTCYSIPCIHDPFISSKGRDQLMKKIVGEL